MINLLQRVSAASVVVANETIAQIEQGLLVLVGLQSSDDASVVERQLQRLLNYRVFADSAGKMNLSLVDVQGGLLLVPQFTLVADTRKGRRPSFASGANPQQGKALFDGMVAAARLSHPLVQCGRFGADMQVHLVNDGPVTFILD